MDAAALPDLDGLEPVLGVLVPLFVTLGVTLWVRDGETVLDDDRVGVKVGEPLPLEPDVEEEEPPPATEIEGDLEGDVDGDAAALPVLDGLEPGLGDLVPLGVTLWVRDGVTARDDVPDDDFVGVVLFVALRVLLALEDSVDEEVGLWLGVATGHALTTTGVLEDGTEQLTRRIRFPSLYVDHSGTNTAPSVRTDNNIGETNEAAVPTPSPLDRDMFPASVLTFPSSVIARTRLL